MKEAGYEAGSRCTASASGYSAPAFDLLGRYAVEQQQPEDLPGSHHDDGRRIERRCRPGIPSVAQLAAGIHGHGPGAGRDDFHPKPVIKANLAAMGEVDPKSVEMRVSGLGLVARKYDDKTKTVSYKVTQDLRDKSYTVILTALVGGKRAETRWDFNFDPAEVRPQSRAAKP